MGTAAEALGFPLAAATSSVCRPHLALLRRQPERHDRRARLELTRPRAERAVSLNLKLSAVFLRV
jgi:hypothetical protein